jgi:hypothetical protein
MTDEAEFERLAMAILREAKPEYASLLHPGVNTAGKTIKSPVDGISFVPGAQPPYMIAAHHTTCARNDLQKKWLHDPATVKPQKGGQPTMPPGDLIKTAKVFDDEKKRIASLRGTLILTTNQEPSEVLVREVNASGLARGLEIDIWSVSRLAHFLDNTAAGQWLRRQYLGIDQERLSKELLAKLSRDSLHAHRPSDDATAWVLRGLDTLIAAATAHDVVFIVAESGLGKSVACYKCVEQHVASGGFGLILPHQIVSSALTIEQAIDTALRQLHPTLAQGSGNDALSFCSAGRPLLVVVEDINKSGQAQYLAEKLATWSAVGGAIGKSDDEPANGWRLFCPVWPQVVASLKDEARKQVQRLAVVGMAFIPPEGREAVQRRARGKGIYLSDMEADSVSDALGHDPLLIALHEPGRRPAPERVIEEFIGGSVSRLASERGDYTASEYRSALRALARETLLHRELNPKWQSVSTWLANQNDVLGMLRRLVHHGEVIHLSGGATDERLAFRHDRVRDALFADAIGAMIQTQSLDESLLSEPYFAEVFGAALLFDGISESFVDRVRISNPLALFHALRLFREPSTAVHNAILSAIERWLAEPGTHGPENAHLRWEALAALSETESTKVTDLVRKFNTHAWTAWQALFRNGDVAGGLNLCLDVEPGTGAVWRDRQIEHAKMRFGANLRKVIGQLLQRSDLEPGARIGALRLAGYLADPQLAEPIESSWNFDAEKSNHLADYLWAAAQCCGGDPNRFLAPVCDAWAALPSEREDNSPSPRDDLAAHNIRWAFIKDVPISAIGFFIKRAANEDLRWPITFMLHGMDHPDAVEFVVRELAEKERQLEGTKLFSPFSVSAADEWRRRQEDRQRPMSRESRDRLLALWQNAANDKHIRKQAFRFWAVTDGIGDLELLRAVDATDLLADSVLWQRLRRKDQAAIPDLLKKLKGTDRVHWWHLGQSIWSDELTRALDEELVRRESMVAKEWGAKYDADYTLAELIMRLPIEQAQTLLLKHWAHLRYCEYYLKAALYVATPQQLELVKQAVESCAAPKDLFKHIGIHYGIRTQGRAGVTRRAQIEALIPYLDFLDEHTILTFWEVCNDQGWFDLRQRHFDARVSKKYGRLYIDENAIFAELDRTEAHPYWIDRDIEDFLKAGIRQEQVMAAISKWLSAKKTLAALTLAAMAVVHAGRREDLKILDVSIEPKDAANALLSDTRFAVHRRTLR